MAGKRWTKEQIEHLNNWYGKKGAAEIAQEIGRTKSSVQTKAAELGLQDRRGKWTDEDVQFLQENYLTLGAEETARHLGKSVAAVHGKIRKVGGGRASIGPRVVWTEDELDYLREHNQEMSWEELGKQLGRTPMAVQVRASMLGLKKYIDPFPFFETWTEESAYVVGFFAADGWATKRGPASIRIGFAQNELGILQKLQAVIGTGRISYKASGSHHFYVQSVKTYEHFCKIFGRDVCKKSRTLQWPDVPDEYIRHFIRGAVDGDGSLFKHSGNLWSFAYTSSSFDFASALTKVIFDRTGIVLSLGENKESVWHARCTGIKAVCLADWLYRDATISLERKAWIAREMMETRGIAQASSITPKMRATFPHIIEGYQIV
jgi:hypothetical protein